jgi:hypothetical protein
VHHALWLVVVGPYPNQPATRSRACLVDVDPQQAHERALALQVRRGVVEGVPARLLRFAKARHLLGVSASLIADLTASS